MPVPEVFGGGQRLGSQGILQPKLGFPGKLDVLSSLVKVVELSRHQLRRQVRCLFEEGGKGGVKRQVLWGGIGGGQRRAAWWCE